MINIEVKVDNISDFISKLQLGVIGFFIGLIPTIYRRFSFDGISIRQLNIVRVASQEEVEKKQRIVIYSFIVKLANSSNDTVIVSDILDEIDRVGSAACEACEAWRLTTDLIECKDGKLRCPDCAHSDPEVDPCA